jgi:hypothetical protein
MKTLKFNQVYLQEKIKIFIQKSKPKEMSFSEYVNGLIENSPEFKRYNGGEHA